MNVCMRRRPGVAVSYCSIYYFLFGSMIINLILVLTRFGLLGSGGHGGGMEGRE